MANITRIRVESKKKYHDKERNFKEMFQEFKFRVADSGILHSLKEKQFFETKTQRQRRKKKAAISKRRNEALEKKIIAGERVQAPSGLVKKVLQRQKRDKHRNKRGFNEE